jgi:hypothetical protein
MGHKQVCLDCRKAFSIGTDFTNMKDLPCPECNKTMELLPHRFRPPRKSATRKWEAVKFLVKHGFRYHHIAENNSYAAYPENLRDAKIFVEKYKEWAIK